MKKVVLAVMLFLVCGVALASSSTISPNFTSNALPVNDQSMHFLGQLFGSLGAHIFTTPNDTGGGDLVGQLFRVLNYGILVVAGLWMAYTIMNVFLSAAMEGGFNSPNKKIAFVFLRLALGFALIIPNTSGYSTSQQIMMKIVVEGISLADTTWSYALQYLKDPTHDLYPEKAGDSIFSNISAINVSFLGGAAGGNAPIRKILDDEVCMDLGNYHNSAHPHPGSPVETYTMHQDPTTGVISFPGFPMPGGGSSKQACGSATPTAVPKSAADPTADTALSAHALFSLAKALEISAQQMAALVDKPDSRSTQTLASVNNTMMIDTKTAMLNYLPTVKPLAASTNSTSSIPLFFTNAANEGWFSAGSFYWDLAQYNDNQQAQGSLGATAPSAVIADDLQVGGSISNVKIGQQLAQADSNITAAASPPSSKGGALIQTQEALTIYAAGGTSDVAQASEGGSVTKTGQSCYHGICTQYTYKGHSKGGGYKFSNSDVFNTGIGLAGLGADIIDSVANIAGTFYTSEQTSSHAFYDPIYFMMQLGSQCLAAAGNIWSQGATIVGVAAGFAGACQAVNPGASVMQSLMSWLSPLYIATASGLFVAGFMLTFYAPLYPYLLFLFGGISWILYVIEAMVAAPLVSFGLTHPDGQELLGKAEQGLMLALGVFLRPVLMVIGFLTGLIMTYIAFAIVNFGFSHVLFSVFYNFTTPDGTKLTQLGPQQNVSVINGVFGVITGSPTMTNTNGQTDLFTGHEISDFLLIPVLLVFYGFIVIEIVNQCFSLIHVLPDMALKWIGGPVHQDRTEGLAQKVGSSTSGAAKQIADVGGASGINAAALSGGGSGSTAGSAGIGVAQQLSGGA